MRLLYIGESWLGSCARSLKEALARRADVVLDEVSEDSWFPKPKARWLRALNRLTAVAYRHEFNAQVISKIRDFSPDVVMAYKGSQILTPLLVDMRKLGLLTANVYPDCSPHAHGIAHREAIGLYDLVISTKAFHPEQWNHAYGYTNRCAFVPQGFDPKLHLVPEPPADFLFDVVLVATYRSEYGELIVDLAKKLDDPRIRVAIGGYGWEACRAELPATWSIPGEVVGRGYISLLRAGKICIAPVTRNVLIDGHRQPGDVDTTRTYELAAAHCFFVHQRTEYAKQLYEAAEVPMFSNAQELADHISYFLNHDAERVAMAAAAHRRAVRHYSLDQRAEAIVQLLQVELANR